MEKQLIFFDIDGTLFDEDIAIVPPSTLNAIALAQQNGHQCFINTGRPRSTIDEVITHIPFDGYICGCGTYVEYQGQEIFHIEIDEVLCKQVIETSFDCQMLAVLEGKDGVYFPENLTHPFILDMKKRYEAEKFPVHTYTRNDLIHFDKYAVWYTENSDVDTYRQIISQNFEIIQRDVDFLEVVPLKYSKATGIQFLADFLHTSIANTISIGDSTNDIPMLTYTKESVAMGNSNPILFDLVTYITTNLNDNGIENALKHFQII